MALDSTQSAKIINEYRRSERDTGSCEVQVALLTKKIELLTAHLQKNKKDNHSRRGLIMMVNNRRSLLDYLQRVDAARYASLISSLGLRR